jgi:hypothetical protein
MARESLLESQGHDPVFDTGPGGGPGSIEARPPAPEKQQAPPGEG